MGESKTSIFLLPTTGGEEKEHSKHSQHLNCAAISGMVANVNTGDSGEEISTCG